MKRIILVFAMVLFCSSLLAQTNNNTFPVRFYWNSTNSADPLNGTIVSPTNLFTANTVHAATTNLPSPFILNAGGMGLTFDTVGRFSYTNANGATYKFGTNGDFSIINYQGATFMLRTNFWSVVFTNGNSLVFSNGQLLANGSAVGASGGSFVGTNVAVGGVTLSVPTNEIYFYGSDTNLVPPFFLPLSATVFTNNLTGAYVITNSGAWRLLAPNGQEHFNCASNFIGVWSASAFGIGSVTSVLAAQLSGPIVFAPASSNNVAFNGLSGVNANLQGTFAGAFAGILSPTNFAAQWAGVAATGTVASATLSGTATNLLGIPSASIVTNAPATNFVSYYTIKPVGSFTDHLSVFTNLQECFNVISNTALTYPALLTNSGLVLTYPAASYSVHLDGRASCYSPSGFGLFVGSSCSVFLSGDHGARIIGDSNVLYLVGMVQGENDCLKCEVSQLQFLFKNPQAKTAAVWLYSENLNFHDNVVEALELVAQTNGFAHSPPIYGADCVCTNPPGMIGLVGFGEHTRQTARNNYFFGCAVGIVAAYPHWDIEGNVFYCSKFHPANSASIVVSNAWSAADQYVLPTSPSPWPIQMFGWECALGADVMINSYSGDTIVRENHFSQGVYLRETSFPALGPIAIYYNTFETPGSQFLITSSNFLNSPFADYWGNSSSTRGRQCVNVFNHSDVTTLSNIYLYIFSDTSLNGTYNLSSASTAINSGTDFDNTTAVWTNANTDARLFLNPSDGDDGTGIYTSNSVSGNLGFYAGNLTGLIFNGFVNFPVASGDTQGFVADNASTSPGNWQWGTNITFQVSPTYTVTNFQVLDGMSRIMSNGVTYLLGSTGVWSSVFTGNGSGLTNLNPSAVAAAVPPASLRSVGIITNADTGLSGTTNTLFVYTAPSNMTVSLRGGLYLLTNAPTTSKGNVGFSWTDFYGVSRSNVVFGAASTGLLYEGGGEYASNYYGFASFQFDLQSNANLTVFTFCSGASWNGVSNECKVSLKVE